MSQTEKKLKKIRSNLQSRVVAFKDFLAPLRRDTLSDVDRNRINRRASRVATILDEFNHIQNQIEELPEADGVEHEEDEQKYRLEFEDLYDFVMATVESLLEVDEKQAEPSPQNAPVIVAQPSLPPPQSAKLNIKLPTIVIPSFNGNYDKWLEFRDVYKSLIHENESINDMQRYHYLRAALEGDAAEVIKSLEFSANNYDSAWTLLCDRYNNSPLLVHNHVKALFALEAIKVESSQKLRVLVDSVNKHLSALKTLGQETDSWGTLLIHILSSKLDNLTIREWEESKQANRLPELKELLAFMKQRADLLETLEQKCTTQQASVPQHSSKANSKPFYSNRQIVSRALTTQANPKCTYCQKDHWVNNCETILKMSIAERMNAITKAKLCVNCLKPGHSTRECRSQYTCKKCHSRHHSLLHMERNPSAATDNNAQSTSAAPQTVISTKSSINNSFTILPTAIVLIDDKHGNKYQVRALLDSGSQANFITDKLAQKLKLKLMPVNITVLGVGQGNSLSNHACEANIYSRTNNYSLSGQYLVTSEICGSKTPGKLHGNIQTPPPNLTLADPEYLNSGDIDILIGSTFFWQLLCVGQHSLGQHGPIMQKTRLGWVVAGPAHFPSVNDISSVSCKNIQITETNDTIENACEVHFLNTHKRETNGRFIVEIPVKDSINNLGESYTQAKLRFFALERKLDHNKQLKQKYTAFIEEYIQLGHMSLAPERAAISYYLPHHCVQNENSITTKLRVVFDGSAKASCGTSINDHQLIGPVLQSDLFDILIRFRMFKYVVTADIAKMYRQVLVKPEQRPLQRILWRKNNTDELQTFNLNTVTYGTAAASYLSIRCLEQLAREVEQTNPAVARVIRKCFYVDDLIAGFDSIPEAISVCNDVASVLSGGCFPLRKWASNTNEITSQLAGSSDEPDCHTFNESDSKILGLKWARSSDTLSYDIQDKQPTRITKRIILSEVASIFDPLGLVGASTVIAKIMLQKIWQEKLKWDESLPCSLANEWKLFRQSLKKLNALSIPRFGFSDEFDASNVHLHGFCDASAVAYGACIYLSTNHHGNQTSNLLCAKSKVAPLKRETIPRLELCAANLLAKLYNKILNASTIKFNSCTLWSDSTVVLCWLRTEPRMLKPFISNRVRHIQSLTQSASWRYIPSESNPADAISRGVMPNKLQGHKLWWQGPDWIGFPLEWPSDLSQTSVDNEFITSVCTSVNLDSQQFIKIENYSFLRFLVRTVAYIIRFIQNLKKSEENDRILGMLSLDETESALKILIKLEQRNHFFEELQALKSNQKISGRIGALNPFLDFEGILRVGGRLRHSNYPVDKKHPMILPARSHLSQLIVRAEHVKLFHAGPQNTLSSIREKYWPIDGRNLARKIIHDCIICRKCKPIIIQPMMGDLPPPRVTPAFPFLHCGVDFGGPFMLKTFAGRGAKSYKAYISLFVCLSTRAIHLELVTSLDTPAFVACLRRFIARRGRPAHMYSDNGTNFRGANNELKQLYDFLNKNSDSVTGAAVEENIRWHFIPAYSPNFGGLWEAGIKSCKHHLTRVVGDRLLTYEDFSTFLSQIEAILNSRPISPLSNHPDDNSPLTPAHLLIGRSLLSVPDSAAILGDVHENRLNRYERIQSMVRGFWKSWSTDYINQLQQRTKWRTPYGPTLKVGDLVLLQEPNTHPLNWKMGRITATHEGSDGHVRVVSVKTTHGLVRRAVSKLSPLVTP